jgi:branched-chain amino acid transport system permease protein
MDLLALFGIYLIVTISLNIQRGLAGIPQFGLMFAIAGGAYITGNLATRIAVWILGIKTNLDPIFECAEVLGMVNPILSSQPITSLELILIYLVIGAVFGAILGLIQVAPAIRLREDYLAITLLAFAEIINAIVTAYKPFLGGVFGVQVPSVYGWAGKYRFAVATFAILVIAAISYLYAEYLSRTPLGRTLKAIRENEVAAASLGKSIVKYRAIAIIIGSALCGMAGTLWTLYGEYVTPTYNRFYWTFLPWLMILLGGIGNNRGALLGTAVFVTLDKLIIYYKYSFEAILPFDVVWLDYILLGIITAIVLIYRPQGLLPERPHIPKELRERIKQKMQQKA